MNNKGVPTTILLTILCLQDPCIISSYHPVFQCPVLYLLSTNQSIETVAKMATLSSSNFKVSLEVTNRIGVNPSIIPFIHHLPSVYTAVIPIPFKVINFLLNTTCFHGGVSILVLLRFHHSQKTFIPFCTNNYS